MDWTLAIKLNQDILHRSVVWLFTWLKLEIGGSVETLPRHKWRTVLFVLRPSESALRRLIFVAMFVHGISASPVVERMVQTGRAERKLAAEKRARISPPPFKLIDPRKRFDLFPDRPKYVKGPGPRVTDMWSDDPIFDRSDLYAYQNRPKPTPDDEINAAPLCDRMNALLAALGDLPGQASRMATLRARLERRFARTGKPALHPLRPGLPPGHRQRQKHEVDEVLRECHQLALSAQHELKPPEP